jgi:hypothetical protein
MTMPRVAYQGRDVVMTGSYGTGSSWSPPVERAVPGCAVWAAVAQGGTAVRAVHGVTLPGVLLGLQGPGFFYYSSERPPS